MDRPVAEPDTPTVGPLRIHKGGTPPAHEHAHEHDDDDAAGAAYTFPTPPSGPLPYPDDRPARTRFDGTDPNRPTVSLYGHEERQQQQHLAQTAQPQPSSSGADTDGLFQKKPQAQAPAQHAPIAPFPNYHQHYWGPTASAAPSSAAAPAPPAAPADGALKIPAPQGLGRFSSTASTSTVKAHRGSPPPPETPATDQAGPGGIEARYAAAGIAGTSTLTSLQAQSAAAAATAAAAASQRAQHTPQPATPPPDRPWTPTERPGSQPYGPPTVYQGAAGPVAAAPAASLQGAGGVPNYPRIRPSEHPLDNDMQRLNVADEPPPAYSSLAQAGSSSAYPDEKGRLAAGAGAAATSAAASTGGPSVSASSAAAAAAAADAAAATAPIPVGQVHPAYANDPHALQQQQQQRQHSHQPQVADAPNGAVSALTHPVDGRATASPGPGPASPPPLPEGWIAHLDPNSGQYYYIHLPTQSTQWEFPKGPTPLHFSEPLSPTQTLVNATASPLQSSFQKTPIGPGGMLLSPQQSAFPLDQLASPALTAPPAATGFTGPPPTAGVDIYKVAPTNGVYFGPYLRYTNIDLEAGLWLGSILIVTDAPQPPTIHIHQSVDLSPNPRQLKAHPIYTHQRWLFYRYDVDLRMEDELDAKWTYAVTSHLGCTRYEFVVAGRQEQSWRFIAHSGNDFSLNVSANERQRLGGIGFMWKDILQKHIECGGFHVQLGLGNQISADRIWKELPLLKQWTAMGGKDNRKNAPWTAKHEEDVLHAYFHFYTSHFDQAHLREAFAQIPHVLALDDHDIFDGYGSYPDYMQGSHMFRNIGRIGVEMYLLFQHHTTPEVLLNVSDDRDIFTVTGVGWHFVKFLGPAVVVVGPDCRSERTQQQVIAGPTYQGLFPKIALLPASVQHCIWMLPVPLVYPRLDTAEQIASTMATGKKAVTGTFNVLGKVTSSVAGVVGAKHVVGEGFNSVKKAVGKSGLMSGILSPFGDLDLLDELRDLWTHESKDLERTYLIRTLQGIAHNKSLRMTFFSGGVNCCGAGLLHDASKPSDHKTMYQMISSAVVNVPPGNYVMRMLHNQKALYVPQNGHRTSNAPSDTKEDMMEIFGQDVNGAPRELRRLMARRNYAACVAFNPDVVNGTFGKAVSGHGSNKISLAIDFMVQNEGVYGASIKYGPVIIPSLEYGH